MRKLLLLLFILSGCSGFPYEGVIKESSRYVSTTHPKAFQSFVTKKGNIHYISLGNKEGPLVVMIHGSPGSWQSYANFFKNKNLLEKYQVVTFDRPGYGHHQKGVPHGSLDDQIYPASQIIQHLNPHNKRPTIVVGHSYGGPVATYLAMKKPKKVQGVVLLAAAMDPSLEEVKWYQVMGKWIPFRWLIPSFLDVCNREILALKSELERIEPLYKKMSQHFYVLQGEIDKLVPKENLLYLKKKLPAEKTSFELIPNARHFLPWAFPSHITEAIDHVHKKIQTSIGG